MDAVPQVPGSDPGGAAEEAVDLALDLAQQRQSDLRPTRYHPTRAVPWGIFSLSSLIKGKVVYLGEGKQKAV